MNNLVSEPEDKKETGLDSINQLPCPNENYSLYKNFSVEYQAEPIFGIDMRYEIGITLNQNSATSITCAKDKLATSPENTHLAIKKFHQALINQDSIKRVLRELKICRYFQHENIAEIKSILLPRSRETFKDIFVSSSLMDIDLHPIIQSPQILSDEHVQFFLYQILRGLKYLHSAGIIHGSLSPQNLLVNSNCDLKICGFSAAQRIGSQKELKDNQNVRCYGPPEQILGITEYGPAVDIWSTGCIVAELLNRRPFLPGNSSNDHLNKAIDVFGTPSEEFIRKIPDIKKLQELVSLPYQRPKALETLFSKDTNPLAVDLLEKMLRIDWDERITVEDALKHPYLKRIHYPYDEPIREVIPSVEFDYENMNLSVEKLKDLVYEEILLYHFDDFKEEYLRKVKAGESPYKGIEGLKEGAKDQAKGKLS